MPATRVLQENVAVLSTRPFQKIRAANLRPVGVNGASIRTEHYAGSVLTIAQDDSALGQITRDEFRRGQLPIASEPRNLVWIQRDVRAVTAAHASIARVGELAITTEWARISHPALLPASVGSATIIAQCQRVRTFRRLGGYINSKITAKERYSRSGLAAPSVTVTVKLCA